MHAADTPANPPPPASDASLRRPPTQEKKEGQKQKQKRPTGRFLLLLLLLLLLLNFFFFSVGWPRPETVRGVAGGPFRGVGAMDGAIELTWTYLQHPLHGPPATPNT